MDPGDRRGVLYPDRLPTFHRVPAPAALQELVRWFWIPRWNLPPGLTSRQRLLPFPASNLVVDPEGVSLCGPTTGASHRDLQGSGWAMGALLRPAAVASLIRDPRTIRDLEVPYEAPELHRDVVAALSTGDEETAREAAVAAFVTWAKEHLAAPDPTALLANAMEDVIASERSIVRVEQVARHLCTSVRSAQRLAERHVGLAPLAIIRRHRLQEAAQRLREDTSLTVARVAADLGYADQAHLAADFRRVLGLAPRSYRQDPDHASARSAEPG